MAEPASEQPAPEHPQYRGAPVPMYDKGNQLALGDKTLAYFLNEERTRALREMSRVTGTPRSAVGGDGLEWAIRSTPRDAGVHFLAHGISKQPVEDFIALMENGLSANRTFYYMPFTDVGEAGGAFGADMPFVTGGIIVVAGYDRRFPKEGDPGIKYIVLGEEYMRTVDVLQEQYQSRGIQVLPWHDAPRVLTEEHNRHGENRPLAYPTIDPGHPLRYPPKKEFFISHRAADMPTTNPSPTSLDEGGQPPAEDVW